MNHSLVPVGVEGEFNTAYWVGNALIRNGFRPSSVSEEYININCISKDKMTISAKGQTMYTVESIDELVYRIKKSTLKDE